MEEPPNTFDLELEIHNVCDFSTHLKNLADSYLNNKISKDELVNVLLGLAVLIEVKADKLFEAMCAVCYNGIKSNNLDNTHNHKQMNLDMAWD